MPLYDFECPRGHVTERFLTGFREKLLCNYREEIGNGVHYCLEEGEYRPSFWHSSRAQNAQSFSPVVIHRDVNGNVRFPGHSDAPVPAGFQKVELSTVHDIRKFEREMNAKDTQTSEKFRTARAAFLDGQLKANREAVDAIAAGGTWQGTDERGNIIERRGLSPKGQKILDYIRSASKQKQAQGRSSARPEFFIEAFSKDASNREDHRDARTDWNRVRK